MLLKKKKKKKKKKDMPITLQSNDILGVYKCNLSFLQ